MSDNRSLCQRLTAGAMYPADDDMYLVADKNVSNCYSSFSRKITELLDCYLNSS